MNFSFQDNGNDWYFVNARIAFLQKPVIKRHANLEEHIGFEATPFGCNYDGVK